MKLNNIILRSLLNSFQHKQIQSLYWKSIEELKLDPDINHEAFAAMRHAHNVSIFDIVDCKK